MSLIRKPLYQDEVGHFAQHTDAAVTDPTDLAALRASARPPLLTENITDFASFTDKATDIRSISDGGKPAPVAPPSQPGVASNAPPPT